MTTQDFMPVHIPVLATEVLKYLVPEKFPARLIDGTLGNGGHSALLLEKYPQLELLGIDRDADALGRAKETLDFARERVKLVHGRFSEIASLAASNGWGDGVDLILLDIGVSSPQIDDPARGFSWRAPGPLDMRMDRGGSRTASRILNASSEEELTRIFRDYGEIHGAARLARAVVSERETAPFGTTTQLAALCDRVLGGGGRSRRSLPAPTLVFQAIRIAVNDELGELERTLPAAMNLLRPCGRMGVIAFHSLEDRIVKRFFRRAATQCLCPPGLPVCVCGHRKEAEILTPHAVVAGEAEIASNRRAACAKFRAVQKIEINDIL